jgi:hypothetical protein
MSTNPPGGVSPPPVDFVTVLHAPGHVMTKSIDRRKTGKARFTDFGNAYLVYLKQVPIESLDHIAGLLGNVLLEDFYRCVVFGAIADPARVNNVRRVSNRQKDGYEATIRACAHLYVPLDIDDVPIPEGVDAADLHACALAAINTLPRAFHGARCVAQATSGHGLKSTSRLRLWFWFTRPVTGPELSVWLKDYLADHSTFKTPSQPIYTARPLFADGQPDHLRWRLTWVNPDGVGAVEVPPAELLKPPPRPPAPPRPQRVAAADETDVEAFIKNSLARLEAAEEGTRHRTRFFEARLLGGIAEEAGIDDETIVQWLLEIHPPPDNHYCGEERSIREGIASGREAPVDIPCRRGVSLLRGLKIEGDAGQAPSTPPQKDNRATETRRQVFALLRQRVPGAQLLAEVHAFNEQRAEPLYRDRVNDLIAWAVERHIMETKNV